MGDFWDIVFDIIKLEGLFMSIKNTKTRQGNKRIALLLVLKALEQMSDKHNPIKQITLAKMVNDIGGALNLDIWCDRKTVGKHLKVLRAAGYNIITVKGKGCYLKSNKFTKCESEIIAKLIDESGLPNEQKELLLAKLASQHVNLDKKTLINNIKES